MSAIRFGLIGYGAWGSHHARAIANTEGAELVAVAARSETTRQQALVDHPGITVHDDYRELLQNKAIDVVDVVLPSVLHHEVGCAVLQAGKHMLLEKPMALTADQCDDLIRLAKEKDRLLAIGHELRLSSLWSKAREMVADGSIGDPLYLLIELWRRPYRLGSEGWRYDINQVGSWILEEPIHFFDLARWYLADVGDPVSIYARANSKQEGHPELHDNFTATVNFPNGRYAVISQTLAAFEHHQVVKVTGTKGALWANWSGAMDRTFHPTFWLKHFDGEVVHDIRIDKITGEVFELQDQMAMMVEAITARTPVACEGIDGKWAVSLCLAAQRSIETGGIVTLS